MFQYIFNIRDNAAYTFRFRWLDDTGAPVDITGYTFLMQGRVLPNADDPPVFELSTAGGEFVVDGTVTDHNEFTVTFPPGEVPVPPGYNQGYYYSDMLYKVGGAGDPKPVGFGVVAVSKGPTVWA